MRLASARPAPGLTRALVLGGGALVTAGTLAFATPSEAGAAAFSIQDDRLASEPLAGIPARIALLKDSNTKVARVDLLWSLIAPTKPAAPTDSDDPAYDFSRIDAIVLGLADAGITPFFTIFSAPSWAAPGEFNPINSEVNPNTPAAQDVADFYEAVAERYAGDFEQADGTVLPEVRHFEVWNEPNISGFLSPQVQNGKRVALTNYLEMVRKTYPAVKRSNGRAIVIAGVGGPRSSTGNDGTGALKWLQDIARSNAPFDGYSQHVYPAAAPTKDTPAIPAWSTVPDLIEELDKVKRRRGIPLFITEAGYTTEETPFRKVKVTPAQQATYMRQIANLDVVKSNRVPLIMWFNLQDNVNWPGGIYTGDLTKKPSYSVFKDLAAASSIPASFTPRGSGANVTLSAGQLLINQRISQAAVRRANFVQQLLDAGLDGDDIRDGGLKRAAFAAGVDLSGTEDVVKARKLGRTLTVPKGTPGSGGNVRLAASQLRINQKISQAAVRRSNALAARMGGALTGGDITAGSLPASKIAAGLTLDAASPPASEPRALHDRHRRWGRQRGDGEALRRPAADQPAHRTGRGAAVQQPDRGARGRPHHLELRGRVDHRHRPGIRQLNRARRRRGRGPLDWA